MLQWRLRICFFGLQSEVHLNNLAKLWARGLDIGGNTDTNDRCKNALLSQFAKVPKMQGLRKDHKPDMEGDPTRGPPLRPLVSARSSPNAPLSNLMSGIVKGIRVEMNKLT